MSTEGHDTIFRYDRINFMKTIKHNTDHLIFAYLMGELDDTQKRALHQWIDQSDKNKQQFIEYSELWSLIAVSCAEANYDEKAAFDKFKSQIKKKEHKLKHRFNFNWQSLSTRITSIAAAIIILIALPYITFRQGVNTVKKQFSDITVKVPMGSNTNIVLPDGTKVKLNAGSELTYSQGFGMENRDLKFTGEGYFEVTKNPEMPFTVSSQELSVKVLGTIFNFKNYKSDDEAIICLRRGKVQVNSHIGDCQENILLPNEMAILNKRSKVLTHKKLHNSSPYEWTKGFLFFDEELLPDIAKELERAYGVSITLADKELEGVRFYGNFVRKRQNIVEVLDLLSRTNKLAYSIEDKNIILTLKR